MTKVGRAGLAALCLIATSSAGVAQPYGPGVTDTEIKFGNIMPYSGPASSLSVTG
ncbi:MAG: Extracellular ligand-binding receptor, partial [Tardiphaga sp.]|nr:Extracellular ligand-binding receptor [Tardiphaga sp.]